MKSDSARLWTAALWELGDKTPQSLGLLKHSTALDREEKHTHTHTRTSIQLKFDLEVFPKASEQWQVPVEKCSNVAGNSNPHLPIGIDYTQSSDIKSLLCPLLTGCSTLKTAA